MIATVTTLQIKYQQFELSHDFARFMIEKFNNISIALKKACPVSPLYTLQNMYGSYIFMVNSHFHSSISILVDSSDIRMMAFA